MSLVSPKRARRISQLYRPLYRDAVGMVLALIALGLGLLLLFSSEAKAVIGIDRFSLDLMTVPACLYFAWSASARFLSDRPFLEIKEDRVEGHWSLRELPVRFAQIRGIQLQRRIAPWRTGGQGTILPKYWLQIDFEGKKKPGVLCLSPGQVLGGLVALRRFAQQLKARMEEAGLSDAMKPTKEPGAQHLRPSRAEALHPTHPVPVLLIWAEKGRF